MLKANPCIESGLLLRYLITWSHTHRHTHTRRCHTTFQSFSPSMCVVRQETSQVRLQPAASWLLLIRWSKTVKKIIIIITNEDAHKLLRLGAHKFSALPSKNSLRSTVHLRFKDQNRDQTVFMWAKTVSAEQRICLVMLTDR